MWRLSGRERGIVALLAATFFWGTSIVVARIFLREISPFVLAQVGALINAATLLISLSLVAPHRLRIHKGDWWRFAVLGGGAFALGGLCINVGIQRTSAATAATLQYLAPAMTLAFGWLTRTERVDIQKLTAVVLTIFGAALTTGVVLGRFVFDPLGVLACVGSAACFSFITIFSKAFAPRYDPFAFTGLTFLAMGVAYFLFDPAASWQFCVSKPAWLWRIVAYSIGLGVLPTALYFYALKWVEATSATIVLAFEIVVTSVLGWLWLGEALAGWQILGAAMVIIAVVMIERQPDQRLHEPAPNSS
ncbi:MAG: EamA family transporter [Candidatus Sumerlaeaceae bacterium]|nr:EamA family transporter [Candidatus Sumerlaeaceae bacterium]